MLGVQFTRLASNDLTFVSFEDAMRAAIQSSATLRCWVWAVSSPVGAKQIPNVVCASVISLWEMGMSVVDLPEGNVIEETSATMTFLDII